MGESLVSVILPVYNRQNTIKRAIDSVLSQSYAALELIVIDDASTDNTVSIVNSYEDSRINLICLKERGGANRARNVGISRSKGEFIAFQDSDDEWCGNKLAVQTAFMQEHGFLACFSPYYLHDNENIYIVPSDYQSNKMYHNNLADVLRCYNIVGTPTLIFKRQVLSLLGGMVFDETLPRFQEYELMLRLVQILDIGYVEEPLVNAYRLTQNISTNWKSLYDAVIKILKKHKDFLDIKAFLSTYIIKDAEYKDILQILWGIDAVQNVISTEQIDLKTEMITYLSNKLKCKNLMMEKLFKSAFLSLCEREFVIYGTGAVAKKFYEETSCMGLRPEAFIVSTLKPEEPKEIDGIWVYTVKDYPKKNIRVIICTSLKFQNDILDNLAKYNYSDICICDEKYFDL